MSDEAPADVVEPHSGPVFSDKMLQLLMSYMRPPWIFRFALANRSLYTYFKENFHYLFDLLSMLSYYFPNPVDFRILQSRTGLYIGGSFALQFMGRVWYGLTDIDLYVAQYAAFVVIDWLLCNGY
ncbi:hypothetical protein AURDEDRAFT_73405, partial [Auricularia subglabra TFB-10046 SS5]